jgi:hypothetical protein
MIVYSVRSRSLLDIVNDIRSNRLILSPFFQRNLVWRLVHKTDFIETILKGYPFPQIFLARGKIDVEKMQATSCVVDGQQRLNAIVSFLADEFSFNGRNFSDLSIAEKESFLKYQVAVIELDLSEDDPKLVEVFKRLNRTFYSLTTIEKYSTEYSSSEFMIVAKVLCGELLPEFTQDDTNSGDQIDPNIPPESLAWAKETRSGSYQELVLGGTVFTPHEAARMVHLMFTLNVVATHIGGFYNRNDKAKDFLDEYSSDFPNKDEVVKDLDSAAKFILSLGLSQNSYWLNKANAFSLLILTLKHPNDLSAMGPEVVKQRLTELERNLPKAYEDAAKEGVNNKKERHTRHGILLDRVLGQ